MTHTDKAHSGFRPVDSGHLESLGKQAARMAETGGTSLNDAVVQTIGHEKLNSEQVRRVVEFTNVEAFNRKFAALEGPLRAVQIDGGPADPVQVLQNLNNDARPLEVTMESLDYSLPPMMGKQASRRCFVPTERTTTGIRGDIVKLQRKLAAAHETLTQDAEAEKYKLNEGLCELVERTKSACLQGAAPGEVYEAWFRVSPEMAKTAFQRVAPVIPPTTKVAGRRINPAHAVVETFKQFAKTASAYAGYTQAVRDLELRMAQVDSWLTQNGG